MNTKRVIILAGGLWLALYVFRSQASAAPAQRQMTAFEASRF